MRRYIKVAGFVTDDQMARYFAFYTRDQGARESDELAHPNVVNLLGLLHEEMCYARVLSGIFWILASQEMMHVMGFDQDGGRNMVKNAMDNHKSIHHLSVIRRAVTQALICEYVIVNDLGRTRRPRASASGWSRGLLWTPSWRCSTRCSSPRTPPRSSCSAAACATRSPGQGPDTVYTFTVSQMHTF